MLGDKTELAAEDIRLEESMVVSGTSASDSSLSSSSGSIKVDSLNLQTLEREAIKRAISLSNGNLTQAAEFWVSPVSPFTGKSTNSGFKAFALSGRRDISC